MPSFQSPSNAKEFVCIYCGAPSARHPNEQEPPFDYCHPEDHDSYDESEEYSSSVISCPACGFPRPSNESRYGCVMCALSLGRGLLETEFSVTVTKNV
ncbi:MAG: hypothetical protein WC091_02120 [Sulfuricellaceae bacterium]